MVREVLFCVNRLSPCEDAQTFPCVHGAPDQRLPGAAGLYGLCAVFNTDMCA